MRSSFDVQKGDALLIAPVPETWNGKQYTAEAVKSSRDKVEAHVNRVEGRGTYHVRLVSCNEQDILNRVRTGQIKEDYLKIEPMQAGLITTLRLTGGLGIEAAARFQKILREYGKEHPLILIDLTQLFSFATGGVGMFYLILKEAVEKNQKICVCVEQDSRVEEMLVNSKVVDTVPVYDNREKCVTVLLQGMIKD